MRIRCKVKDVKNTVDNIKRYDLDTQQNLVKVINSSLGRIGKGAKQRVSSRGLRTNIAGRKLDIKSRVSTSRANYTKGKFGGKVESKAPHSHLVEFGTRPHSLDKGARRKKMVINGQPVAGKIMHPGAKAKPFMQPSYYSERSKYIAGIRKAVEHKK